MRRRLHDLSLAVEGDDRAVAAAAELLGALPPDLAPRGADLRLVLRPSSPRPRPAGASRFYHGLLECFADGEELVLWDRQSVARVRAGGAHVEVEVAEASLRDGYLFAHLLLHVALVLALRWRGFFHLHAGALLTPEGRGLLVAGGAGAGKSTLTIALLESGCAYLGDDSVFLWARGGEPAALALPRPFHVAPETAGAFPRLAAFLSDLLPAGEKRRLDPRQAWPGRERGSMAPSRLLLPRVSGGAGTVVSPLSSADALGALIESSAHVVVDGLPRREEHLDVLRRVADAVQCWSVDLGLDLLQDPAGTAAAILRKTRPDPGATPHWRGTSCTGR